MPRYLLAVYGPAERTAFGNYPSKDAMLQAFADTGEFNAKLERDGHFVFADGLQAASSATTVDARGEAPVFTPGPIIQSEKHIDGFWVIEAANLDEQQDLQRCGHRLWRRP